MPYPWPVENGVVRIGGVPVDAIAQQFDTPCYLTDAAVVEERFRALHTALAPAAPFTIAYACKANTNLAILRLLTQAGCGIDAVSPGEVAAALKIGVPPARIMFTGTNPRDDELTWLLGQRVWINCDAVSVLRRVARLATTPRDLAIRINPRIGAGHHAHVITGDATTQFGIHPDDLPECLALLAEHGHRLTRLHTHIGSGVMSADPFIAVIDELGTLTQRLAGHAAVAIDTVDIGGGLGVPYRPEERAIDLTSCGKTIGKRFRQWFDPSVTLMIEPGRFLVAESTVLLARVTTIKPTPHTTFLGIDAGFNTLLRPILYGAYHHIGPATQCDQRATTTYTICGPLCETGDVVGVDRSMRPMVEGDLVVIYDTGAYGFSMNSTYNSRPRPAEVMVHRGQITCIRRRETIEELFTAQVPAG